MAAPLCLNMQGDAAQPCQLPSGPQHHGATRGPIATSSTGVVPCSHTSRQVVFWFVCKGGMGSRDMFLPAVCERLTAAY